MRNSHILKGYYSIISAQYNWRLRSEKRKQRPRPKRTRRRSGRVPTYVCMEVVEEPASLGTSNYFMSFLS
jgi:hypothetical protein